MVFDVKTGQRVFEVGDELDVVLAADINENHTRIALGGPGKVVRIFSTADGSRCRKSASTPIGSIRHRVQPRRRAAGHGRPQRRLVRVGSRYGPRISESARATRARSPTSPGGWIPTCWPAPAKTARSSCGRWRTASQVKNWNAHPGGVTSVRFAHDGRLVSTGRDRDRQNLGWRRRRAKGLRAPGRHRPASGLHATTTPAWRPATGWAKSACGKSADGKLVAKLPLNPPTLAMAVEAETQQAAAAAKALEQAAGELTLAQDDLEEKSKALGAANDALAAGTAAAQKAAAELAGAADVAQPEGSGRKRGGRTD